MRTDAPLTFRKQGNDAIRCEGLSLQNFLGYLESNLDGHNVPADVSHLEGLPLAAASQPVLVLEIQEVLSLDSRASYRNQSCVKTIVKQKRMHSDMQSFGHCTLRMAWMYACWMDLSTIFPFGTAQCNHQRKVSKELSFSPCQQARTISEQGSALLISPRS